MAKKSQRITPLTTVNLDKYSNLQKLKHNGYQVKYCKTSTVKFLNFRTPEIFAVIYLKFKQRGQFDQNGANGIANSEDPDQTAPLGAV